MEWTAAATYLRFEEHPTTLYYRSTPDQVEAVRAVPAATASPGHSEEVRVSRPSKALAAQRATDATFTGWVWAT